MIRIVEDMRDVNIYLSLRKQVGWIKLDEKQAQRALDNSVKVFTVYDGDKPIGMGRIVGDGAVICWRYGCNKLYSGFNNNTGISE